MSKQKKSSLKKNSVLKRIGIFLIFVIGVVFVFGVVIQLDDTRREPIKTEVHTKHTYSNYVCSECGAESPSWMVEDADGSAVYLLTDEKTLQLKAGTVVDFFDESWGYIDKLKGSVIERVETESEYTVLYFGAVGGTSQTDIADHVVAGGYCRIAV